MSNYLDWNGNEHNRIYIQTVFLNKDDAIRALKEKLVTNYPQFYPCEPIINNDFISFRFIENGKSYENDAWIEELNIIH